MKYLAAYLLLVQGGNASPSAEDIKSVIESVGVEVESAKVDALLSALEGKTIEELIAEGNAKFATVPAAGAAVSSGSGAASSGAAAEEAEEEKEEEKEESDEDMGFGLFD
ncbi:60S acidic ribosomal protein P2 [Hanseniaspora osmophila]|uniref:60S acidic ribosomal protein P2-beta n=1 Tax=Hanseniaspora osmophila TaxID=56408 RepID=A0A1E5RBV8_9ASCO|nr:60S acidic ribosomal protein P2-beta [Hanseniaspora osmophila]